MRIGASKFMVFMLLILFGLMLFRKLTMYFVLTLISAAFVYVNYYIRLPFDVSPVLFLSMVISYGYGFWLSLAFIVIAGFMPMIFAGGSFDHTSVFYLALIAIVNFLVANLHWSFIVVALPLAILHHVFAAIGAINFGTSPHKEILNMITKISVDSFYLLVFSNFVFSMIG